MEKDGVIMLLNYKNLLYTQFEEDTLMYSHMSNICNECQWLYKIPWTLRQIIRTQFEKNS